MNRRLLLLWLAACAKEATPAPIQEPPKPIVERSGARLKIEAGRITELGRECSIERRGDAYFCGDVRLARVVPHADMAVVPIWFEGADGSVIHDGFHDIARDADCTPTKFIDEADYVCVVDGRHVPEDPHMTPESVRRR